MFILYRNLFDTTNTTKLCCTLNYKRAKAYGPDVEYFPNITGYGNDCKFMLKSMLFK